MPTTYHLDATVAGGRLAGLVRVNSWTFKARLVPQDTGLFRERNREHHEFAETGQIRLGIRAYRNSFGG